MNRTISFQKLIQITLTITIACTVTFVANYAYGQWADPTDAPPNGNSSVPLNTSTNAQIKSGDLGVDSMFVASTTYSGRYCDLTGDYCFLASDSPISGPSVSGDINGDWPDILLCGSGSAQTRLYADVQSSTANNSFRSLSGTYTATFSADGTWAGGSAGDCANTDMSTLKMLGRAYSFGAQQLAANGRPGECYVRFDTVIAGQNRTRITWIPYSPGDMMAIGMYYYGDADDHNRETNPSSLNYSVELHTRNWGSSWIDSSEMVEIGYWTAAAYAANAANLAAIDGRSYIVIEPFSMATGEILTIVNQGISEISAGTAQATVNVLGCF